jgi:hypothetical protein
MEERRRRRGCFDQLLDGNFSICLKWGQKQQRILFLLLHLFLVLLLLVVVVVVVYYLIPALFVSYQC